jgi:magnesium-transporting ATPase (P-type)
MHSYTSKDHLASAKREPQSLCEKRCDVVAIRLGRRIYDNLRKAMSFVFAVHVPIAGLALIPVLATWPLVLLPVHIVFLELIIDPACSIVFEAEPGERGLMRRHPRDPGESLLSRRQLTLSFFQGFNVLVAVIAVRHSALPRPARNNGACAHVCHACYRQSHAHPGKPVLEPYRRCNPSWTQSRVVVGGWRDDCGACAVDLCPVFALTVSIFSS